MIRVEPFSDDLELLADQALRQKVTPSAWTITVPTLKDRDIIIRYNINENNDLIEEFRYEVLDVTRNKTVLGQTGSQKFNLIRLDKTDPVYQFPVETL